MWSAAQLHAFALLPLLPTPNQSLVFVVFFAITPTPNPARPHTRFNLRGTAQNENPACK
jgi:hypothetical protein